MKEHLTYGVYPDYPSKRSKLDHIRNIRAAAQAWNNAMGIQILKPAKEDPDITIAPNTLPAFLEVIPKNILNIAKNKEQPNALSLVGTPMVHWMSLNDLRLDTRFKLLGTCVPIGQNKSVIFINPSISKSWKISVIIHEIGHAMGLPHSEVLSIMAPWFDAETDIQEIDIEALKKIIKAGRLGHYCNENKELLEDFVRTKVSA